MQTPIKSLIKTISTIMLMLSFTQFTFADNKEEMDEIWKFSKNFFSKVYESLDTSSKSSHRLSLETWISQKSIEDLINKNDVSESFQEITDYCDRKFAWKRLTCEENLISKYYNEEDMLKLESEFFKKDINNEIWADWDVKNSFFDLVYDLNIIDIILFWEDATIFYYKYWKLSDPFDSGWDSSGSGSENKIKQISNYLDWNYDDLQFKEATNDIYWNEIKTELVPYSILEQQYHWSNQEIINSFKWGNNVCSDPHKFVFKDKEINPVLVANELLTETVWNKTVTTNIKTLETLWIPSSVFFNLTNFDSKDMSALKIWEDGFISFIDLNENKEKECSEQLYWWLICLDELKKSWLCTEDKNFCIEISKKNKDQNVLGDSSSYSTNSACINCIVKIMINIIEEKLMWNSLNPKENSNKNWNLPNWLSVFKPVSKILDVTYLRIPWLTEKDPYDLNLERIKKEREYQKALNANPPKCFDRSTIQNNQQIKNVSNNTEKCEDIVKASKKNIESSQKKESRVRSRKTYFDDVFWRFKEFRELFEDWIEENVRNMPFQKWENIEPCNTKG